MKKILVLLTSVLILSGCNTTIDPFNNAESNEYVPNVHEGELGTFDLISPTNNAILEGTPSFSWNASSNADTYKIEICSDQSFVSTVDSITYYSCADISTTTFNINADLNDKNTTYYWRVTAINNKHELLSSSTFSFYLKAVLVEEVEFDIGDADDWTLHNLGSHADISIDRNNFFNNGKDSLVVSFKKEDVQQGIVESDGWIIVTKTIEKTIYGTDGMFLNFYYAGQDTDILIRLVDKDNEYWYKKVKISANARQSVILRFDDFLQRKKDVPVENEVFDYERIKYMEVVFEKVSGDGVCLISNVKAVKMSNYAHYFIKKLDFEMFSEADWVNDTYEFEKEISKYELTLKYYGTNDQGKPKINSYGFAKLYVRRYFDTGDTLKVYVKYTGKAGTNILIRIYEEDTDRWVYRIPFKQLEANEYNELIIPFAAFTKSDLLGDGKRQFYNIINIQFGLEGAYETGTISFKDFEIVDKSDYIQSDKRVVGDDGLVENFNDYRFSSELYMSWQTTENNKDEQMTINNQDRYNASKNAYSGQFEYKSDMEPAGYGIMIETSGNFNALKLSLKDKSVKSSDPKFNHVTNYSPKLLVYIYLLTGEHYYYELTQLKRVWFEYTIPFGSFKVENAEPDTAYSPITPKGIALVGFTMSYYYYDSNNKPTPVYTNSNVVLADDIYLTNASEYKEVLKDRVVNMNGDIAFIEDFESYETDEDIFDYWSFGNKEEFQELKLSNDVSSKGGKQSIDMKYQGNSNSPSYAISPVFDSSVEGQGIVFDMKGDGLATVYINIYLDLSGSTQQYRYKIVKPTATWKTYTIGFSNFTVEAGQASRLLTSKDMIYISKITFGMTYSAGSKEEYYHILIDNIRLDNSIDDEEYLVKVIA